MTKDKKVFDNILDTIGQTPLIRLNSVVKDFPCPVYAKVEFFNPGNSIKDRMAVKMLEVAEQEGKIKPGGTIIEGTSGNTGMGLALAAIQKGYKCIFTSTDKQSKEKFDMLRALGAEVIVCHMGLTTAVRSTPRRRNRSTTASRLRQNGRPRLGRYVNL